MVVDWRDRDVLQTPAHHLPANVSPYPLVISAGGIVLV